MMTREILRARARIVRGADGAMDWAEALMASPTATDAEHIACYGVAGARKARARWAADPMVIAEMAGLAKEEAVCEERAAAYLAAREAEAARAVRLLDAERLRALVLGTDSLRRRVAVAELRRRGASLPAGGRA